MITPANTYPLPYGKDTHDVDRAIRSWSTHWMAGEVNFSATEQREAREALTALVADGHADLERVQAVFAEVYAGHMSDLGIRSFAKRTAPVDLAVLRSLDACTVNGGVA